MAHRLLLTAKVDPLRTEWDSCGSSFPLIIPLPSYFANIS